MTAMTSPKLKEHIGMLTGQYELATLVVDHDIKRSLHVHSRSAIAGSIA
jgi:hypothetical protein